MQLLPIIVLSILLNLLAVATPAQSDDEARLLQRSRRLTYEGRRAGEGYFSADGSRMVLQSERVDGNPFFQIFELDLETGDTRAVSPGHGKTTCAFYRPGTNDIEFASTHHDPSSETLQRKELEKRAAGTQERYAWDYDPEMDIYVEVRSTGELVRLTTARGYDAEGSYSPDGEWIVFTSNRSAYDRELTVEEQRRLEIDPAYFAEIYLMAADGSRSRRLTTVPGYDGGPFFMPGGERIVWRRFEEDGLIADVWTMKPDGSDQRRITDFGAMSWAPYPHPSGRYFVFASNKLGFDNFELYMVDAAGTREPVRVTYTAGFDGLPVFAPDGDSISWTTNRAGGQGQIYLARWHHEAALEALATAPRRTTDGD